MSNSKNKPAHKFADGFKADNFTILGTKGRDQVAYYTNEFKGKTYAHIRSVWENDAGELNPGKGLSVPVELMPTILMNLNKAAGAK